MMKKDNPTTDAGRQDPLLAKVSRLLDIVESVTLGRASPTSDQEALGLVKQYLPEKRHRIRLHDLIHEETDRVAFNVFSDRFESRLQGSLSQEAFEVLLRDY